jgi:Domain of unknown function (DUF5615)
MKFLIDNALSPALAVSLQAAGHVSVHVRDVGLRDAADGAIMAHALGERRVGAPRRPAQQAVLLLANLGAIEEDLARGAVAAIHGDRLRVRRLPLAPGD